MDGATAAQDDRAARGTRRGPFGTVLLEALARAGVARIAVLDPARTGLPMAAAPELPQIDRCDTAGATLRALSRDATGGRRAVALWHDPAAFSDGLPELAALTGQVGAGALLICAPDGDGRRPAGLDAAVATAAFLIDPEPTLAALTAAIADGFALSEAARMPVVLDLDRRVTGLIGPYELPSTAEDGDVLPEAVTLDAAGRRGRALDIIRARRMNAVHGPPTGEIGLILPARHAPATLRALELLGLADSFGVTRVAIHVLTVTEPLVTDEIVDFCRDRMAVLVVDPAGSGRIERGIAAAVHQARLVTRVAGRTEMPQPAADPLTLAEQIGTFVSRNAPRLFPARPTLPARAPGNDRRIAALAPLITARAIPPDADRRTVGTALDLAGAAPGSVAILTAGEFWRFGLERLRDAVRLGQSTAGIVIVPDGAAAAASVTRAAEAVGTEVHSARAARGLPRLTAAAGALLARRAGRPAIVVYDAAAPEQPDAIGIDAALCTGDHACIRLAGALGLTIRSNPDPLVDRPIAAIVPGAEARLAAEAAEAAGLCPAFHRIVPRAGETGPQRFMARLGRGVIHALQRWREAG